MSRLAGPFLKFTHDTKDVSNKWNVSILVVTDQDNAPTVVMDTGGAKKTLQAEKLHEFQKNYFWTYLVKITRTTKPKVVTYQVAEDEEGETVAHQFHVPVKDTMPAMAYGSCAGFHSSRDAQKYGGQKHERWHHLLATQQLLAGEIDGETDDEEHPLHLLLMGGDQVYADAIWTDDPESSPIAQWHESGQNPEAPFSAKMKKQAELFYIRLYLNRWTQQGPAEAYASIPSIMMWDDHDIFDGWGSYSKALQACPVHQGIFQIAAQYFRIFQQHSLDASEVSKRFAGQTDTSHGVSFDLDRIAIVAPDLRGNRDYDRIMGRQNMDALFARMDQLANKAEGKRPKHLLLMLSMPLMYPNFRVLEKALQLIPGTQELEDDLHDHWTSKLHMEERLRLIHRLIQFAKKTGCRVTVLSGDVHVGALSRISYTRETSQSNIHIINQLISSGIVNTPPNQAIRFFLEQIGRKKEDIDRYIEGEMQPFPNTSSLFIAKRNYLTLQPDGKDRIWANLHAEGDSSPFVKVIHPKEPLT